MIAYVNTQMSIWGKWSARKASNGMGYSHICPMFKQAQHGGGFGSSVPIGVEIANMDEIQDCDKAVQRLSQDMRMLAIEFYVVSGKGEDVATRLGIKKRTLYDRIDAMHQQMLGHLNDVIAGC